MLKGWEWANPLRRGAESSYPRTVVNWLCDIRTRARDNLHADVPCQRLEAQLLRRCEGKSGLFLTLHWLISSSQWQRGPRQMWPRVHTVAWFFFFLSFWIWLVQTFNVHENWQVQRSKPGTGAMGMKQASPEPVEMLFGRLGGAVVPDYQAASKVTHLNCWNQDLPTSAASFAQTRLSAGVKRKLPGLICKQSKLFYWYFQTVPRILLSVFLSWVRKRILMLNYLSAQGFSHPIHVIYVSFGLKCSSSCW